jgi:tetratricopeptide (TPR) repeat protein
MVDTFTRLSGTRLSGTRPSPRAGLTVILCLAAGLALPHGRPGAAEPQAACLADPTAACIFALAEDLARLQTPPERHIVAVAVAWAKAGDFARAATVIDSLQPFAPSHDDALRRMASVAASQNRDETLASILAEIRNERTREQARAEAAVAFARAGHLDAAQSLLTTLSFPSGRATVLAEIGLAEERAGRSNEAMAAFSAAEEAITQGEVAKSALGTALARAGHIDRALAISETLVAGTPLYALQVAIVSSLLEADRIPQALDVIDGIPNAGIREAARLKILAFLLEAGRDGEADALATTFADGMGSPRVLLAYARALARPRGRQVELGCGLQRPPAPGPVASHRLGRSRGREPAPGAGNRAVDRSRPAAPDRTVGFGGKPGTSAVIQASLPAGAVDPRLSQL